MLNRLTLAGRNEAALRLLDQRQDHDFITFYLPLNTLFFVHAYDALHVVDLDQVAEFASLIVLIDAFILVYTRLQLTLIIIVSK